VTQSQTGRDKKTAETGSTETKWRRNQEPERHSKEAGHPSLNRVPSGSLLGSAGGWGPRLESERAPSSLLNIFDFSHCHSSLSSLFQNDSKALKDVLRPTKRARGTETQRK
jgi:hypothetical protein